jgi:hypothetical protein
MVLLFEEPDIRMSQRIWSPHTSDIFIFKMVRSSGAVMMNFMQQKVGGLSQRFRLSMLVLNTGQIIIVIFNSEILVRG